MSSPVPLVVDLDGTLLCADLVRRGLLRLALRSPWRAAAILASMARDRAAAKKRLAILEPVQPEALPYDGEVLAVVRAARAEGRRTELVSGSDQAWVDAVATHVGLFDEARGSDGVVSLTGSRKAAHLVARFGSRGFDYVGNAWPDLKVWAEARTALLSKPEPGVLRTARAQFADVRLLSRPIRPTFLRP